MISDFDTDMRKQMSMEGEQEEPMTEHRLCLLEDTADTSEGLSNLEDFELLREIRRARNSEEKLRAELATLRAELESVDAEHRKELQEEGRKLGEATVQAEAFQAERNLLYDELATLRAKMAGMVCGTCYGRKTVRALVMGDTCTVPCPVCQPAKEEEQP